MAPFSSHLDTGGWRWSIQASDDRSKKARGANRLEPHIKGHGRSKALVTENLLHQLKVAGVMLEKKSGRAMTELVRCQMYAEALLQALGDLKAKGTRVFATLPVAGEQTIVVSSAHQVRTMFIDVSVDELGR